MDPLSVLPRAYQDGAYQWSFQRIPPTLPNGSPNPARDSAVFVVHGMGEQAYADTAVQLRNGFEGVIERLSTNPSRGTLPTPYILDGYWANYDDFEQSFPEQWTNLERGEKDFFMKLWHKRTHSRFRAFFWFARQALRLILTPQVLGDKGIGFVRWLIYVGVALLAWIGDLFMLVRYPKILAGVLEDVRLYTQPQGVIEKTIVQRIDRRVGEKFLLLLGLDWDFRALGDKRLKIAGEYHEFKYVTWVAHSLGSVVSYNVISDLFARCQELSALLEKATEERSPEEKAQLLENPNLLQNIQRVEKGLHRFFTIGSPLEKFTFLFPAALRPWPQLTLNKLKQAGRQWWVNFFHVWDPVSGMLRNPEFFPNPLNLHSQLLRFPFVAHISYWKDNPVLTYFVTRTYGRDILPLQAKERPKFLSDEQVDLCRFLTEFLVIAGLAGLAYLSYRYIPAAITYATSHPSEVLQFTLQQLKRMLPF